MSIYINKFNKIIIDLNNTDIKTDKRNQVKIFFCSLPNSFDNFVEIE